LKMTNKEILSLRSKIGLILAKIWTPLWTVIFGVVVDDRKNHVDLNNFCFPWPFALILFSSDPSNRDEDFDQIKLIIGQVLMEIPPK